MRSQIRNNKCVCFCISKHTCSHSHTHTHTHRQAPSHNDCHSNAWSLESEHHHGNNRRIQCSSKLQSLFAFSHFLTLPLSLSLSFFFLSFSVLYTLLRWSHDYWTELSEPQSLKAKTAMAEQLSQSDRVEFIYIQYPVSSKIHTQTVSSAILYHFIHKSVRMCQSWQPHLDIFTEDLKSQNN